MPIARHFVEGLLEWNSNVDNVLCTLDDLATAEVIDGILVDYVLYLVGRRGHYTLDLFPGKMARTQWHEMSQYIMRCLVDQAAEFQKAHQPLFESRQALLLKSPQHALLYFQQTLEDIWADGLANWERFLGSISFVGAFCLSALDAGLVYLVKCLVETAVWFIDQRVGSWVKQSGGWRECFLRFSNMQMPKAL